MNTAADYLKEHEGSGSGEPDYCDLETCMKNYAMEAIKEDRRNIATYLLGLDVGLDVSQIIDAPKIDLI